MSNVRDSVLSILNSDEPKYEQGAKLGSEALEPLREIIQGDNLQLASKAVFLASMIPTEKVWDVMALAASRPEPIIRVAAAGALRNLAGPPVSDLLNKLLDDKDIGVRKFAMKSAIATQAQGVKAQIEKLARDEQEPLMREFAQQALKTLL